jgi:hypothetical protein
VGLSAMTLHLLYLSSAVPSLEHLLGDTCGGRTSSLCGNFYLRWQANRLIA